MNKNSFNLGNVLKELEGIQDEGAFDVRDLMSALLEFKDTPGKTNEEKKQAIENVKQEVQRRSARLAAVAQRKAAAASPMRRNNTMRRVKPNTKSVIGLRGPVAAGKTRANKNRPHSVKAIKPKNNKTRNNRPLTKLNKNTRPTAGKSIRKQIETIFTTQHSIKDQKMKYAIDHLKNQYDIYTSILEHEADTLTEEERKMLSDAIAILYTNPAVQEHARDRLSNGAAGATLMEMNNI